MIFPAPSPATNKLLLVYRGTIGLTSGSASDPVDAGIAIAAAPVHRGTLTFDLTWDDPNAEVDFYLTDPCGVTFYEPDLYTNISSTCCTVVGGDDENTGDMSQHMVVTTIADGGYQLWVNFEEEAGPTNAQTCTLTTSSSWVGALSTNTFTLTTADSGQYNHNGWPTGVVGPATQDSWYIRTLITISNGVPVDY